MYVYNCLPQTLPKVHAFRFHDIEHLKVPKSTHPHPSASCFQTADISFLPSVCVFFVFFLLTSDILKYICTYLRVFTYHPYFGHFITFPICICVRVAACHLFYCLTDSQTYKSIAKYMRTYDIHILIYMDFIIHAFTHSFIFRCPFISVPILCVLPTNKSNLMRFIHSFIHK